MLLNEFNVPLQVVSNSNQMDYYDVQKKIEHANGWKEYWTRWWEWLTRNVLKWKENHTNELQPTNHILHKACNAHTWMHMIQTRH